MKPPDVDSLLARECACFFPTSVCPSSFILDVGIYLLTHVCSVPEIRLAVGDKKVKVVPKHLYTHFLRYLDFSIVYYGLGETILGDKNIALSDVLL